jgi:hypothetical protein
MLTWKAPAPLVLATKGEKALGRFGCNARFRHSQGLTRRPQRERSARASGRKGTSSAARRASAAGAEPVIGFVSCLGWSTRQTPRCSTRRAHSSKRSTRSTGVLHRGAGAAGRWARSRQANARSTVAHGGRGRSGTHAARSRLTPTSRPLSQREPSLFSGSR